MRAWSQSPMREAEGPSRLHNTITAWPDSGYPRRIAFIPGAPPPVAATRVPANRNRDRQENTCLPGTGESCRESLQPTLCFDAPGGHLAHRWGVLLRHLRLPRLGHQTRLFVDLDPL